MATKKNTKPNLPKVESTGFDFNTFFRNPYTVIFLFSFAIYFNSIFNGYNLDDELVTQNHRLTSQGISAIPEIFNSPYYSDNSGYKYEYRPIVLVSFAIEHSIWGDNPFMSHLVNVLLYSLACILLLYVLILLLNDVNRFIPILITVLFAAHPIHTEVVASIKNRDEILVLLFCLSSLLFALKYSADKNWRNWVMASLAMLLGMLSKPSASIFAFIVPFTLVMLTKASYRTILLITLTLFIPAIVFARLYYLKHQVFLLLAIISALTFFYALRNSLFDLKKMKAILKPITSSKTNTNEEISIGKEQHSYTPLKGYRLGLTSLLIILICISAGVGVYVSNIILIIVPAVLLIAAYTFLNPTYRILLIPAITAISTTFLIRYHIAASTLDAALMILLHNYFLSTDKRLKTVSIFSYAIYALLSIVFVHSYFPLTMVVFAGYWNLKLKPAQIILPVIAVLWALRNLYPVINGTKSNFIWLSLLMMAIGSSLYLWKNREAFKKTTPLLTLISLGLVIALNYPKIHVKKIDLRISDRIEEVSFTKSIDLTPVDAKRPLKFIEIPVNETDPISIRIGTAFDILIKYLQREVIGYPMSYYYGYAFITPVNILDIIPLFSLLVHLSLFLIALFLINRWAIISYSIVFYLSAISIYSTLFVPIPGMMGDRFLLIPSIGFSIVLAFILLRLFKQDFTHTKLSFFDMNRSLRIAVFSILFLYSGMTFARNFDWKDRVTLFSKDISVVENSAQAQNLLALHLYLEATKQADPVKQKELREQAIPHFKRALEIYPKYLNASFDMGRCYEALGKPDEAFEAFENTLKIDSSFVAPCFSMALILHNKGNIERAIPYYEKFLTKYKSQKEVYANLSFAYFGIKQYDKSIEVNKRALAMFPSAFEPTVNIAKTYLNTNQKDSARVYFQKAAEINPNDANIRAVLHQLSSN